MGQSDLKVGHIPEGIILTGENMNGFLHALVGAGPSLTAREARPAGVDRAPGGGGATWY